MINDALIFQKNARDTMLLCQSYPVYSWQVFILTISNTHMFTSLFFQSIHFFRSVVFLLILFYLFICIFCLICVNIFSYKYVNLLLFLKLISIVSLSSNHLSLYMQVPFNLYLMSFNLCTYEHVQQFFYCIFSTFSYKMFLLQVAVFLICMLLVAFVKMTTEKLPNIITFPQELDHHLSNYLIRWYLKKPLPNHLGNH